MRRRGLSAAITIVIAAVLPACTSSRGCGPIEHETLAPDFAVHVLPNAPEPHYLTDPPTSGPHQPTPDLGGTQLDEQLTKPRQIGLLEYGDVLIQYRPSDIKSAQLRPLLGPHVVIAPNSTLHARVIATAWTYKRTCRLLDTGALRTFIHARAGKPPGAP